MQRKTTTKAKTATRKPAAKAKPNPVARKIAKIRKAMEANKATTTRPRLTSVQKAGRQIGLQLKRLNTANEREVLAHKRYAAAKTDAQRRAAGTKILRWREASIAAAKSIEHIALKLAA